MLVIAAGLVGLAIMIFNAQPTSSVVLLPDADGTTGSLVVKTASEQQTLSTPFGVANGTTRGTIVRTEEDAARVNQRYAATLAARPAAPISFTVYFEFGSAQDIAPVFAPVLAQLRAVISTYPAAEITVIGHTDRVGTEEANDALSVRRAETVRELIVQSGIQASSIEVAGRGEREPVAQTADEVAEARNRRVEINLR